MEREQRRQKWEVRRGRAAEQRWTDAIIHVGDMITGVARRPPLRVPAEVSDFSDDVEKALLDQSARPIYVRVLRATPEGEDEQTTHVLVLGPGKGGGSRSRRSKAESSSLRSTAKDKRIWPR